MVHKVWSSIEEVPYCFSRSSVKLQGHTAQIIVDYEPNWVFLDCITAVWVHIWLQNGAQSLKLHRRGALLFLGSSVKLQGHTANKNVDYDPNWAFADCNSSLNSPMATKWCTKFEVAQKGCPVVFHPSNFKVTQLKNIVDFDPNWEFPDFNSSLNLPMVTKLYTELEVA